MSIRRNTFLATKLVAVIAIAVGVQRCSHAQDLRSTLPGQIASTLRLSPPEGASLVALDQPISIGSISGRGEPSKQVLSLWSVPTVNQTALVTLDGTPISKVMLSYFSSAQDFELGYANLSAEQQARLTKAQEVLYSDQDVKTPTKKLARYRKWTADRNKLLEDIQASSKDVTKQLSLNQRLQTIDQDYRLLGEKEQVETALEIVDRSTSQAPQFQPQLEQLKAQAIQEGQPTHYRRLFETISSSTGWVRVTLDATTLKELAETEATLSDKAGQINKYKLAAKSISFQVLLARTAQPLLSLDVWGNRAWRRRDKRTLSLGNADGDPNELLPRYVSDALVVRDVDMHFEATDSYADFCAALETSTSGAISGIPLRFSTAGSSYSVLSHVYLPSPAIVAVVVARTPKSPNQAPDLTWK